MATYALENSLLTYENVSVILEVLNALANASSTWRIVESLMIIMDNFLTQLELIDNLHLISEHIGEVCKSLLSM